MGKMVWWSYGKAVKNNVSKWPYKISEERAVANF